MNIINKAAGVCLGASTVTFVKAVMDESGKIDIADSLSVAHHGDPRGIFKKNLQRFTDHERAPVIVTGRKFRHMVRLPVISEPEAVENTLAFLNNNNKKYNAVASLGGETFIVYPLDHENRIAGVVTGNKCASGTGEFFLQQIRRMNLTLEQAVDLASDEPPFQVSGRCSVFCKSDCTHALNKGTPPGAVAAGLSRMIAEKAEELLRKIPGGHILVTGGVTNNPVVMKFLKEKLPGMEVSPYAACFEAAGAAVHGLIHHKPGKKINVHTLFQGKNSSFTFLKPLKDYEHMVEYRTLNQEKACDHDQCLLGLDVGSTTTKAVLLRIRDDSIAASVYLRTNGNPVKASRDCYAGLLAQVPDTIEIHGLGVTGSGRHIAGLHALTEGIVNEIVAHAKAAAYFDPGVDTLFEIGGQDAKYTFIVNGIPADYAMNEACSAGTGSFLEEAAYESLKVDVRDIASLAMLGMHPPNFNDQCAAFISSDIKTAFQENLAREDVIAGLVYSICINYINRVKGTRPAGKKIFMQGGVCYNRAVPCAMAAVTGKKIIVPPEPGLMGAFGAALIIKEKISLGLIKEERFSLGNLAAREVAYKKSFVCKGGKERCDRKCLINVLEIQGKTYPFGGACNKYYNERLHLSQETATYDYVKKRRELIFRTFIPDTKVPGTAKTVGINRSFHTHTIFPLYYHFFTSLGFKVVLSEEVKQEGVDRELSSFCYPVQLALGLFQDLSEKRCDYYFLPMIEEMFVNKAEHHRINFNSCCVFVSGEPFIIRQAFKHLDLGRRIISPVLNFARGFETQEKKFIEIAAALGVTDVKKVKSAYSGAVSVQQQVARELHCLYGEFTKFLHQNPGEYAFVLFGRTYNAFNEHANKGIPEKITSRGIPVIPYDMFPFENEYPGENMYWEAGKKIMKTARIVKRDPRLFGVYITNFACAPDSMILPQFRALMDSKPSLTLELDGHTADAGINTRIDAAIDVIRNYQKLNHVKKLSGSSAGSWNKFTPAEFQIHENRNYFITSDGEKIPLTDPRLVVVLPSMGDLGTRLFAAGLQSLGIHAFPMPEATMETLKKGRAYTSGKECLPFILCVGHLFQYLEDYWDGNQCVAFFVNESGGPCRLGQYHVLLRQIIKQKGLRNVTTLSLSNEDAYAGLGPRFAMMAWETITVSDVLGDVRTGIMAHACLPELGLRLFDKEFEKICTATQKGTGKVYKPLKQMTSRLKQEVRTKTNSEDARFIALCGEVFVRKDGFSHKWLDRWFAERGFILKSAYVIEFILYLEWLIKNKLLEPHQSLAAVIEMIVRRFYMGFVEKKIKKVCASSGFYRFERTRIDPLIRHSEHILPREHKGETGLTIGVGLSETIEKFAGVINIGPFGCMPTRLTEGLLKPEMTVGNWKKAAVRVHRKHPIPDCFPDDARIPFLSIETDGNNYPQVIESRLETFCLQAERFAILMEQAREGKKKKNSLSNKKSRRE